MRVIDLLKILNISFDALRLYEVSAGFSFKSPNQSISLELYNKIIRIHNENKADPHEKKIISFEKNETYRLNARVKWYFNNQTNGEYGFLEIKGLPDIHFSGKNFLYSEPKNLRPGDEVVVTLKKNDVILKKKDLRALSANLLSQENDISYLLFHLLYNFRNFKNLAIESLLDQISTLSPQISENSKAEIRGFIDQKIDVENLEAEKLSLIAKLLKICCIDSSYFNHCFQRISADKIFYLWLQNSDLEIKFSLFKDPLVEYLKTKILTDSQLLDRLDINQKKDVLDQIFLQTCTGIQKNNYTHIAAVLKIFGLHQIQPELEILSDEQHLRLWENKSLESFPFTAVFNKLIALKNDYCINAASFKSKSESIAAYLNRIKDNDLIDILAKTHYEIDLISRRDDFSTALFFILHLPEGNIKRNYIEMVNMKSNDFYKLLLFLLDYTEDIVYNDAVIYTGLLSADNQKVFFKKVIKLIDEKKLKIGLEDLNRITTIDYQTNEYAKEIDGIGLDFTLSVVLKIIADLKNNTSTSRHTIFDLIANQVKSPKDLLVIDGFFEKCGGRTILDQSIIHTDEDEAPLISYSKVKKEALKPRFSSLCDGRKAVFKGSKEPYACQKSGYEFWWCENGKCYDASRNMHPSSDWKNYTLEDILRILNVSYDETQYEIMLNVINRVNRFLAHLSCRNCNSILKPKGRSNFAFYGVTLFSCTNEDCEEKSKPIYLSHCLNGHCEDIIDSRDSVKCRPPNTTEECGWYICKNCNACCSSSKLANRKSNLEQIGQEYKCHFEGHLDRGIICCSDCGHEMKEALSPNHLYEKQLTWFIEYKDSHANITNYGQRAKDKKWWFIWSRGNYSYEEYRKQIQALFSSGFSIPDFNNKEKDNQLVAEPFEERKLSKGKILACPNCDCVFDLNNSEGFDYARKNAVQKFHINTYPQIDN